MSRAPITRPSTVINATGRACLEAAIDAMIAGPKAAAYSHEPTTSTPKAFAEGNDVERAAGLSLHRLGCVDDNCDCPPDLDRPDPISEQACNDAAALRAALDTITAIEARYPKATDPKRPGVGPCPAGCCKDHWAAEVKLAAKKDRYTGLCRRCGDYRARNGYPIPPAVLKALHACDYDWSHWSVRRAQQAG